MNDDKREIEEHLKRELYAQICTKLSGMVESGDITPEQYMKILVKIATLLFKPV